MEGRPRLSGGVEAPASSEGHVRRRRSFGLGVWNPEKVSNRLGVL